MAAFVRSHSSELAMSGSTADADGTAVVANLSADGISVVANWIASGTGESGVNCRAFSDGIEVVANCLQSQSQQMSLLLPPQKQQVLNFLPSQSAEA